MECLWCSERTAEESVKDCYWVMPDGRRSVHILQVPALSCPSCGSYLADAINQKVEDALYISDLADYPDQFTYEDLLKAPVKNIFPIK
ncbi:YokU family protein [Ammoniphilus sp. 3BR4]|uniref:YokU family protein n=1 Tax=Ammoniphilus sp. 3BR4 TaxID=3158265 RepID=UPI003465FD02